MLAYIFISAAALALALILAGAAIIFHSLAPSFASLRCVWILKMPSKAFQTHWWRPMLGDVSSLQVKYQRCAPIVPS
jgi:hypothetical protein